MAPHQRAECGDSSPFISRGNQNCGERQHSKTGISLLLLLLTLVFCLPVFAQYSIDWSTIDGGGGTSTGGVYSVTGTIGQPDAGPAMAGGNYSLVGGFWSLIAVQEGVTSFAVMG